MNASSGPHSLVQRSGSATGLAGGRLVLVPNTLDHACSMQVSLTAVLPQGVIERAARITHWVVETPKVARALLKRVDALCPLALPLPAVTMIPLPPPAKGGVPPSSRIPEESAAIEALLLSARSQSFEVGLLSDAGLPALADPGADVVALAHRHGVVVEALAGPSSIALALAASGLNGQSFSFVGYVPQREPERSKRLKHLESQSKRDRQTQVAIEAPYRNQAFLQALLATLDPHTQLCVASGLTLPQASVRTQRVGAWRTSVPMLDGQTPAVFAWLAT